MLGNFGLQPTQHRQGVFAFVQERWKMVVEESCSKVQALSFLFFRTLSLVAPGVADRLERFWGYCRATWLQVRLRLSEGREAEAKAQLSVAHTQLRELSALLEKSRKAEGAAKETVCVLQKENSALRRELEIRWREQVALSASWLRKEVAEETANFAKNMPTAKSLLCHVRTLSTPC